jgi:ubiquinone/menaquinone biosynthesis C-methylase UbiE
VSHIDIRHESVYSYNEDAYKRLGFLAQRKYPNEEFCRFMGRNFLKIERNQRKSIRLLELGCGAASNLWMVAKEGFGAYGIDFSPSALPLARGMLNEYGVSAQIAVADMTDLPFDAAYFDCVIDVFSSYCLDERGFRKMLSETARVLKPNGRFFIYAPGKGSDAWKNFSPAQQIDHSTLDGISRPSSAYYPSPYPFRFITHAELEKALNACNMTVEHAETVTRTYRSGQELFEFVVAEAKRCED